MRRPGWSTAASTIASSDSILVDRHRRGERRIEAHQRAVRSIGVEAEKGKLLVDQVLGEDAGHQRFADTALLAADEMDVRRRHRVWSHLLEPPGTATSIVFSTTLPATLTVLPTTALPTDTAPPSGCAGDAHRGAGDADDGAARRREGDDEKGSDEDGALTPEEARVRGHAQRLSPKDSPAPADLHPLVSSPARRCATLSRGRRRASWSP